MFKPTPSLCSKASRLPLTSKKGNRDFFKGTRTGNIMRRKRIATSDPQGNQLYDKDGKARSWTIKTHRIDETRVPCYIVPPGLAETKLKPYVFIGEAKDGGVSTKDRIGMLNYPKMDKGGFDGTYYRSIVDEMLAKRRYQDQQDEQKRAAESGREK